MKIALYDPEPVCGGPMQWSRQTQLGLHALGHECDTVTFTRSGRPRKNWGTMVSGTAWFDRSIDVVGRYKDCKDVLARYDGVVLTEPLIGMQDRQAIKENWGLPFYGRVLDLAGVRFTTALQAYSYAARHAPFAEAVLSLPAYAGAGITHVKTSMALRDSPKLRVMDWRYVPHPYQPFVQNDDLLPVRFAGGVAGCAGRFVHIDGFHVLALAAAYGTLPPGAIVQLRGACAISNRASLSLEVYEALRGMGYEGERAGEDVFRAHDWWLVKDDSTVRYDGPYNGWPESVRVCSAFQVLTSVMADEHSHGATSYSQLEAIDAGCTQVATKHHWRDSFQGVVIDALPGMPSLGTVAKDPIALRWVKRAGEATAEAFSFPDWKRLEMARHNREVLRTEHDPRLTAKMIVEVLGG